MIFRIIFSISSALSGLASGISSTTRILIAAGYRRAAISTLLAAYAATFTKAVTLVARSRIAKDITNIQATVSSQIYDDAYDLLIKFSYQGTQLEVVRSGTSTGSLSQSRMLELAINRVLNSSLGNNVISQVRQEKIAALEKLLSGLPVAAVAFFLTPLSCGADQCFPDTGFFSERVYGWAETKAIAKLSSSGLWELQASSGIYSKIGIGAIEEGVDPQFYAELKTWLSGLNILEVLDEIEASGISSGTNYITDINNQTNEWINGLNSGQIEPSSCGISVNGGVKFNDAKIIVKGNIAEKLIKADIGYIDKETTVPVVQQQFPCEDLVGETCSAADQILGAPSYNCKGFICIIDGIAKAVSFSMGNPLDADCSSPTFSNSSPTLSSLLVPVVINGKIVDDSLLSQRFGHFYANEEQIAGTNSFLASSGERFFLSAIA